MVQVTLLCAIVGLPRCVSAVKIDTNEVVGILKKAIKEDNAVDVRRVDYCGRCHDSRHVYHDEFTTGRFLESSSKDKNPGRSGLSDHVTRENINFESTRVWLLYIHSSVLPAAMGHVSEHF
uniref:RxLR effector candidate protein n=1 Tax=Hyaloperonospora arabidopsidis (strain Emoy2) TaxID=559515 RepID=M4C684_HYAAE|nr:RxLR effector candidate protein [Hyaloperonospora arabidopsidis Emoy2]